MLCENADTKLIMSLEEGESLKEVQVDEKPQKTKGSSQPNTTDPSEQVMSKETTENKRTSVRRQSARLKAAELKTVNGLFETDDTKVHGHLLPDDAVPEHGSTSTTEIPFSERGNSCGIRYESQEFERPYLIRPSRLTAAKKVHSYKEIPLTVKMRRTD